MADTLKPVLTLHPDEGQQQSPAQAMEQAMQEVQEMQEAPEAPDMGLAALEAKLTQDEIKMVDNFSQTIDVADTNSMLMYGSSAQKKISDFSDQALNSIRSKDMGEVGEILSDLVVELKNFDGAAEDDKSIFNIFKRSKKKIEQLKARYEKVEANVGNITSVLEQHQIKLLKDIAMFDKMYEMNLAYFKELTMYILAGKKQLEELRATKLVELQQKAEKSKLPEDAQAVNDYASLLSQFEKKLHDLELTRMVSIQMAPQIRMIQNNDSMMVSKIQSSLVNTIPLWKSQMVLAMGLTNAQQAMTAQRNVTDMTNQLLRKNAETLKMGSIETAKESERSVVDIETLKQTNQTLISTLDEVKKIQDEGRVKRTEAERELRRIEDELKRKLVEMQG